MLNASPVTPINYWRNSAEPYEKISVALYATEQWGTAGDTMDESPVLSMALHQNIPPYTLESLQRRPTNNLSCSASETLKATEFFKPPHIIHYYFLETSR